MNRTENTFPREFLERMRVLLGSEEEYEAFLAAYERPRERGLRLNTLKVQRKADLPESFPYKLDAVPWTEEGFWYELPADGKTPLAGQHPFYYAGLYYLQEPSAMLPASILPIEPGDRVLDLCAAPGGKATAIGAKLQGTGILVANEISASRAKALIRNLEMFGITNSYVTNEIPAHMAGRFTGFFDKILVDAPCSGEGMFRKDEANASAWSMKKVQDCSGIQKELAVLAASMLRPGGSMVYSTCTFSPEEDEQVVAWLLDHCPEMELCEIPSQEGFLPGRPELCSTRWMDRRPVSEEEGTFEQAAADAERLKTESAGSSEAESAGRPEKERAGGPETDGHPGEEQRRGSIRRCIRLYPHHIRGEGHFIALFRKKETYAIPGSDLVTEVKQEILAGQTPERELSIKRSGEDTPGKRSREDAPGKRQNRKSGRESKRTGLVEWNAEEKKAFQDFYGDIPFASGRVVSHSGHLTLLPPRTGDLEERLSGLTVLKRGVYLGEVTGTGSKRDETTVRRKDTGKWKENGRNVSRQEKRAAESKARFEPSQSLALAAAVERFSSAVSLKPEDPRVLQYLRGGSIVLEDSKWKDQSGWTLVCVEGMPVGWGKRNGNQIKNKYHAGWRITN